MKAVIVTGGKQYTVSEGDVLYIEKLEAEAEATVKFEQVLAVLDGENSKIGSPIVEGAAVEAREVTSLETVCCVDKDNPLARLPFVTPEDLAETPLVLFKNSFFQTEQIKTWFASAGVTPNILLQTEQLSTLQSLLTRHNAVGFLFRQLLQSEDSLQPISLDRKMQVQVSLVWRREGALTGAMAAFLLFLENELHWQNTLV